MLTFPQAKQILKRSIPASSVEDAISDRYWVMSREDYESLADAITNGCLLGIPVMVLLLRWNAYPRLQLVWDHDYGPMHLGFSFLGTDTVHLLSNPLKPPPVPSGSDGPWGGFGMSREQADNIMKQITDGFTRRLDQEIMNPTFSVISSHWISKARERWGGDNGLSVHLHGD